MATVDIKLSQNDVNVTNTLRLNAGAAKNGTLGQYVDLFSTAAYLIETTHPKASTASSFGSTLTAYFADGATANYINLVTANPNAVNGTATATGYEFKKTGWLSYVESGLQNYNYTGNGTKDLVLTPAGGVRTDVEVTTRYSSSDPNYSKEYGNGSFLVNGSVYSDANRNLSGSISKITETADKVLLSSVIEGDFKVLGNSLTIGQGLTSSNVSGLLTSYKSDSRDGSHFYVTNISTFISSTQIIDERIFADATRFSGDDVFNVNLPGTLYSDYFISSGAGNDLINISGGGGRLNVDAGAGNDVITIGLDNHTVDGGAGLDRAMFIGNRSAFNVDQFGSKTIVSPKTGVNGTDTLTNIERLQFSDTSIALDINGTAGQAYRVYQAAFNRKPDLLGLGYWINDMDKGSKLTDVAGGFFQSSEFKAIYGSSTPSDNVLITNLYLNVLHRPLDQAGFDYWAGQLKSGVITQAGVLASFSESAENQLQVLAAIQNGIDYIFFKG